MKGPGRKFRHKPIHDFMFIKLEYWGLIFIGIGLVLLVVNFVRE